MNNRIIPIYGNKDKGRIGYTILLDIQTLRVYKAYHKEVSQTVYWVCFLTTLILMRNLQNVSLSTDNPVYMVIIVSTGIVLSVIIGRYIHKNSAYSLKEIYISNETLKDYFNKGKKRFVFELILASIVLLGAILCLVLFLLYNLINLLLLSFVLFLATSIVTSNFSKARFKLYKTGI